MLTRFPLYVATRYLFEPIFSMVQGRATLFARFFSEEDEKLLRSLEGF